MRTIEWDYQKGMLRMIDQRLLPGELRVVELSDFREVASAISDMVVRGAPAIGAAAAFGLALAAQESQAENVKQLNSDLSNAGKYLKSARPTAINLAWAVDRVINVARQVKGGVSEGIRAVLSEAQKIADEDVEINQRMAVFGADLIDDGDTVIHHCNTGALATVDWGTALGVIHKAHELGKQVHVLVDETRPRLQGSRLTAWELQQYGVSFEIISDNAAGFFLKTGQVQKVFFGADRVAANGDVANKIGTYMLALAANDNSIPVYAVVPTSTVDLSVPSGDSIPIEERDPKEVLDLKKSAGPTAPQGAKARNPAFDVTPNRLITAIVTEYGIVYPPYESNLKTVVNRH